MKAGVFLLFSYEVLHFFLDPAHIRSVHCKVFHCMLYTDDSNSYSFSDTIFISVTKSEVGGSKEECVTDQFECLTMASIVDAIPIKSDMFALIGTSPALSWF